MIYYKSLRLVNGKPKWIVIDEDYNIIVSPTRQQIKTAILGDPPKRCCTCGGKETYINSSGTHDGIVIDVIRKTVQDLYVMSVIKGNIIIISINLIPIVRIIYKSLRENVEIIKLI